MKKLIIKTKTNSKESAKQYFEAIGSCNNDAALVVKKYVLSDRHELMQRLNMQPVKQFKDKTLYFQWFSIRLETLEKVIQHFTATY